MADRPCPGAAGSPSPRRAHDHAAGSCRGAHRRAGPGHVGVVAGDQGHPGPPRRRPARLLGVPRDVSLTATSSEAWRSLGYWLMYVAVPMPRRRRRERITWPASCRSYGFVLVDRRPRRPRRRQHPARRFAIAMTFTGSSSPSACTPFSSRADRPGCSAATEGSSRCRCARAPRLPLLAIRLGLGTAALVDAVGRAAPGGGSCWRPRSSSWRSATCRCSSALTSSIRRWAQRAATRSVDRRHGGPRRTGAGAATCNCRGRVRGVHVGLHRRSTAARPDEPASGDPICSPSVRRRRWTCSMPWTTASGRISRARLGRTDRPSVRADTIGSPGDAAFDRFRTRGQS